LSHTIFFRFSFGIQEPTIDGGDGMLTIDKLDHDKVIEVARNMGYDPKKPTELTEYVNKISKMDLWDISQILFFAARRSLDGGGSTSRYSRVSVR
jgi:hypothetical protein